MVFLCVFGAIFLPLWLGGETIGPFIAGIIIIGLFVLISRK